MSRIREQNQGCNRSKIWFITSFCFLIATGMYAQEEANEPVNPKHATFLELAGNAGLYSFNYERYWYTEKELLLPFRVGISAFPTTAGRWSFVLPLMQSISIGSANHQAEMGLGIGGVLTSEGQMGSRFIGNLGYRYISNNRKHFIRAAYTPFLSYEYTAQYQHWFGVGIGFYIEQSKK